MEGSRNCFDSKVRRASGEWWKMSTTQGQLSVLTRTCLSRWQSRHQPVAGRHTHEKWVQPCIDSASIKGSARNNSHTRQVSRDIPTRSSKKASRLLEHLRTRAFGTSWRLHNSLTSPSMNSCHNHGLTSLITNKHAHTSTHAANTGIRRMTCRQKVPLLRGTGNFAPR